VCSVAITNTLMMFGSALSGLYDAVVVRACIMCCVTFLTGQHTRLLTESDPRVEVSVTCTNSQTHWTHISSSLSGMHKPLNIFASLPH